MWALRHTSSNPLRAKGLNLALFRASAGIGPFSSNVEDKSSGSDPHSFKLDRTVSSVTCTCGVPFQDRFSFGNQSFSSQAGAKSGGEEDDDLEDGFSELEASETTDALSEDSSSDSESDLSGTDAIVEDTLENELMKDTEVDADKDSSKKKLKTSALFRLIVAESGPISGALDKFAEGKELSRPEIYQALLDLRRRKLFGKALQLIEWLDGRDDFDFLERDYASRVDLIAKVRGLHKAEVYVDNIPKSFRNELVYRTLLANFVSVTNVSKSEEIFNKMKDLGFSITVFTCNQLILLYKRTDKKKIADVLKYMENENLKPSLFTYQVLIDTKGQSNDMAGMEQVVDSMMADGVEPNTRLRATLAKHYAAGGLKEKAEAVLKEMEGDDVHANRSVCNILLPIYADLGHTEDVERIWKVVKSKPRQVDFMAAIIAWGKLKNIERAEAAFSELTKSSKKLSERHYSVMLRVYAENKMLSKGKDLVKQMGDKGCYIGPVVWDSLVKLHVDSGEVEKADILLQKAVEQNPQKRPLFSSFLAILDQYAKQGDVHNAEKTFQRMRLVGYKARARPFHALLQTYINAKVPAYGMRERMQADNVFPSKGLAAQLMLVDALRKSRVSDLLD